MFDPPVADPLNTSEGFSPIATGFCGQLDDEVAHRARPSADGSSPRNLPTGRYRGMARPMTVGDSIVIAAPPAVLYALISDPTAVHRWSPENTGATVATEGAQ